MAVKRWAASYYDANGKRHRKTFATKPEADLWEAEGKAAAAMARAIIQNKRAQKATINLEASAAKG